MPLTIPAPTIEQDGATPPRYAADQPMNIACGPVALPDGGELTPANAKAFGYRLYRYGPGGASVWDETAKAWVDATQSPAPDAQELFHQDGKWRAVLLAIGQKDAAGDDKLASDASGEPHYLVRCAFAGSDAAGEEHAGESPDGPPIQVVPPGKDMRVGLELDPEKPKLATSIKLFLRDAALVEQASVSLRIEGGSVIAELAAGSARARLTSDGDIVLTPAAGRFVRVDGALAVDGPATVRDGLDANGSVIA